MAASWAPPPPDWGLQLGRQPPAVAVDYLAAALGASDGDSLNTAGLESLDVDDVKALMTVVGALLGPEVAAAAPNSPAWPEVVKRKRTVRVRRCAE